MVALGAQEFDRMLALGDQFKEAYTKFVLSDSQYITATEKANDKSALERATLTRTDILQKRATVTAKVEELSRGLGNPPTSPLPGDQEGLDPSLSSWT